MKNTGKYARKWPAWLACAWMALMLAACGGGGGGGGGSAGTAPSTTGTAADLTPVQYSVTLSMTSGQVAIGRSISMSASVVDSKGNDLTGTSTFAWASSSAALATVAPVAAANGTATVTGVAAGTATIQVLATIKTSDSSTLTLPAQAATITVLPTAASYSLALSNPVLSLADGQALPVKATLLDANGTDVSAAVHDWAWASSIANVQVSAAQNSATLTGSNSSATAAALGTVTVSVTAPNGIAASGQMLVTVQKNAGYTYRLELSQGGAPVNALSVLNGYPQTFSARVIRSDAQDATADFDGAWTYAAASPTLSVAADAATRQATVSTGLPPGAPTVQSVLQVTATSSKIAATPRASLAVTEQPKWALVYNGPQPLRLLLGLPLPIPATATLKLYGADDIFSDCSGWNWTGSANVALAPGVNAAQVLVTPLATGSFSVTATCTAGPELEPVTVTIPGTVS
ncbi:Ig-like domain-containing protein [Cupriavidus sp. 30B13]|uniref:Ig-like domain-containing protein n=1 Tax=Cupriavidus sp. 30B13 TaxID=3384241 RepID=UPI003B8FFC7A